MPNPQDMPTSWEKGDVDAAFAEADVIVTEPIVHQSLTHHPMEPRSTMAYWENGRPFTFVSTQSAQRTKMGMAGALEVDAEELTLVSEFTGGGFGSKGGGHRHMALAPAMSRKIGRPVMHRITRYEENYIGRARPGFQSWVKMGFRADGKCTAIDLIIVQESGAYGASDYSSASKSRTWHSRLRTSASAASRCTRTRLPRPHSAAPVVRRLSPCSSRFTTRACASWASTGSRRVC